MRLLKKRGSHVHAGCSSSSSSRPLSFNTRPFTSQVINSLYCHIVHGKYSIAGRDKATSVAACERKGSRYLYGCIACSQYRIAVVYPGILFGGGGGSINSVADRGPSSRRSGGGSPLVRGSGGSCKLFSFLVL
jgi:hypothetical protein